MKINNFILTFLAITFCFGAKSQTFISIEAESNGKYVSSENGSQAMRANRPAVGTWEVFELEAVSGAQVALKADINGSYVSSENGSQAMTCNRNTSAPGTWETFTLEWISGSTFAIKGNNNKYVSHSVGTGTQLWCTANTVGTNERFVIESAGSCTSSTWNPSPNWSDSYQANGFCWCETTFDHDLDDITQVWFVINGEKRNIRTICDELKLHPNYRAFQNGDPVFNDVQCGNGPANTAIDEECCPGRTDMGVDGCYVIGEGWDIAWLESRPIFGGGSFPDPSKVYYIDAPHHNLRLAATGSSENAYTTSTNTTGSNVEWKFVEKGNGSWHLQRAAGGNKPRLRSDGTINADMQPTSSSGINTYYDLSTGDISGTYFLTLPDRSTFDRLQINNNGLVRMVTSSNHAGTWESFTITEVPSSISTGNSQRLQNTAVQEKSSLNNTAGERISIYPNPLSGDVLNIKAHIETEAHVTVTITNSLGQKILVKDLGLLQAGNATITIDDIRSFATANGIYFVNVAVGEEGFMQRIVLD